MHPRNRRGAPTEGALATFPPGPPGAWRAGIYGELSDGQAGITSPTEAGCAIIDGRVKTSGCLAQPGWRTGAALFSLGAACHDPCGLDSASTCDGRTSEGHWVTTKESMFENPAPNLHGNVATVLKALYLLVLDNNYVPCSHCRSKGLRVLHERLARKAGWCKFTADMQQRAVLQA